MFVFLSVLAGVRMLARQFAFFIKRTAKEICFFHRPGKVKLAETKFKSKYLDFLSHFTPILVQTPLMV